MLFDSHFHVFDSANELIANQGFVPPLFTVDDYLSAVRDLGVQAGAVVAASFQGLDPGGILRALDRLGPRFVGVAQLPPTISDARLRALDARRICGVRFNVVRGGRPALDQLDAFARRVHDVAGWHVELYIDSTRLREMEGTVLDLPAVSIDHLGLTSAALPHLLRLAERGVRIKASGFGRVDFDVEPAIARLHATNPEALMFGTDLPSTRAPRPFRRADVDLVTNALGTTGARQVLWENAARFYRLESSPTPERRSEVAR